ncbi:MAG TPA: hypothetical protein VNV84_06405 [Candidatus Acidoferrales bacterium]|jgi:hypothetical protein|nr:hypothetical protein [Candidatus Acidoferrales bacterium]
MGSNERMLRRISGRVMRSVLKRLADDEKQLLKRKTVGTVPVEAAKPLVKAALY